MPTRSKVSRANDHSTTIFLDKSLATDSISCIALSVHVLNKSVLSFHRILKSCSRYVLLYYYCYNIVNKPLQIIINL